MIPVSSEFTCDFCSGRAVQRVRTRFRILGMLLFRKNFPLLESLHVPSTRIGVSTELRLH